MGKTQHFLGPSSLPFTEWIFEVEQQPYHLKLTSVSLQVAGSNVMSQISDQTVNDFFLPWSFPWLLQSSCHFLRREGQTISIGPSKRSHLHLT